MRSPQPDEAFLTAVAPLLGGGNEKIALKNLETTMLNSDIWVAEPEFAEIMFPPLEVASYFTKSFKARGLEEKQANLNEEEIEDIWAETTAAGIKELLTEELQDEILEALETLSQRLKRSGKQQKASQVTFIQFALKNGGAVAWSEVPLIHALYQKGFEAAMQLIDVSGKIISEDEEGMPVNEQLETAVSNPEITTELEALIKQNPALLGYLNKKIDALWEEATDTILCRQTVPGVVYRRGVTARWGNDGNLAKIGY